MLNMFSKYLITIPEKIAFSSIFILIPASILALRSLYYCIDSLSKEYEEVKLFKKRHNCVVMYREKVIVGWPPREKIIKSDIPKDCFEDLYEPILYFINTAKYSLDVAVMIISIKPILKALLDAQKRGVKVRIVLNFEHIDTINIKELIREGIKTITYIGRENMDSIMHYKYMVKDYKGDGGYAFIGSPNFTMSAFLNNYEDLVFTSSKEVVKALLDNFETCWNYINTENQTFENKVKLADADLI